MDKKLRYLQIGLGSMGKRRIRNLLVAGVPKNHIVAFDLSQERCDEVKKTFGLQTYTTFATAVEKQKPNVLIISTPPHLHAEYCLYAARHQLHFFVEISTQDAVYPELLRELEKTSVVAAPSCTYRFFTPITIMRQNILAGKIGRVEAFLHHCGQYLPDWHPWESYKDFYVSKAESSALKEMFLYELGWISWLTQSTFTTITGMREKVSDLEMNIPDVSMVLLRSEAHVVGTMVIDLISRLPFRTIRIIGSKGTLEWSLKVQEIVCYESRSQASTVIPVPTIQGDETMYEREIQAFLDAVACNTQFPYTFQEDQQYFSLLKQFETHTI